MSRPLYETENDRRREADAVRKLLTPNDVIHKLPIRYGVDFIIFRNEAPFKLVEVKCRNNPRDQYPDLMISVAKIVEGIKLSELMGIPFVLVVEWSDCIGSLRIYNTDGMKVSWGGRNDRGDPQDMEPVYHINTAWFATNFKKRA